MANEMDELAVKFMAILREWLDEYQIKVGDNEPVYVLLWRLRDVTLAEFVDKARAWDRTSNSYDRGYRDGESKLYREKE